ncbi:MAG: CsgG/HfaB family protein [Candidatus Marinimicrobia bacterium]|nr:CsgG/HfaB family protein [Candidatus Neomarinimicrobiota bacterium]
MKNIRLVTLSFLLSSILFSQQQGNTVAVLVFEGRGISLSESTTLSDRFRTALADIGYVRIVEQKMVTDVLVEQGFQQTGCTSDECAVEVGALLGVQYMIAGSIGKVGETFTIDSRMVSMETGAVVRMKQVTYLGKIDGLILEMQILAYVMLEMEIPPDLLNARDAGSVFDMSSVDLEVTGGFIGKTGSTVAVTDFEGRGISSLEAQTLTDRFRTAVATTGAVRLVERRMMMELLDEQGFQQSGCTSDECAIEVGQLLGVEYMLGGAIGKVGDTFTIDARMISVETGVTERVKELTYEGKVDGLITEIQVLAYTMVDVKPPQALLDRRTGGATITNPKTKLGALMRSAILPGFGQIYSDKKIWGYGWMAAEVAIGGLIASSYSSFQTANSDYNNLMGLYNSAIQDDDIVMYRSQAESKYAEMETAEQQIKLFMQAAAGIWVTNMIHAYLVGPVPDETADNGPQFKLAFDPSTGNASLGVTVALNR